MDPQYQERLERLIPPHHHDLSLFGGIAVIPFFLSGSVSGLRVDLSVLLSPSIDTSSLLHPFPFLVLNPNHFIIPPIINALFVCTRPSV